MMTHQIVSLCLLCFIVGATLECLRYRWVLRRKQARRQKQTTRSYPTPVKPKSSGRLETEIWATEEFGPGSDLQSGWDKMDEIITEIENKAKKHDTTSQVVPRNNDTRLGKYT